MTRPGTPTNDAHRPPAGRSTAEAETAWPGGPPAVASPPVGHGASANRSVRVTIGTDGLVDSVTVDPRSMRQGSEAFAELTRQAVRAAQRDWFGKLAEQSPASDAGERLRARLDEINDEYSHRMEEINQMIAGLRNTR